MRKPGETLQRALLQSIWCSPVITSLRRQRQEDHHIFWTRLGHIVSETLPQKKKSSHVNHYPLLLACLQLTYKFGTEPQTKNIRPQYLGTDTDTMEKNSISTWEEKKATYLLLCSQKHPLPHLQGASRGTSGGLHEHFQDYHKPTVWNLAGRE